MAHHPLLLGHRGMRGSPEVKENTIEAFDLALQHGCHGFEFDVRLTGDRRAVICHDPAVDRVKVEGARSGQLGNLALLQQVFERFHSSAFMDVELKVAGLENCVAEIAREFPPERGFVISSFLPEVLERLHPELSKGIICETRSQLQGWQRLKVDYVISQWKMVSEELVRQVHDSGARVFVWTVNDSHRMQEFAGWGADGIISDDTKLLVETLG